MFKVNNKHTRKTHWRRSGVFIVNCEHIFTPCYSISIVYFEHVNAGWACFLQGFSNEFSYVFRVCLILFLVTPYLLVTTEPWWSEL